MCVVRRLLIVFLTILILPPLLASVGYSAPTIKGDPQAVQEVQAAIQKFSAARSWRARMAVEGIDEPFIVAYLAPNRFHVGDFQEGVFVVGLQLWERSSSVCTKSKPPFSTFTKIVMGLILNSKELIARDAGEVEGVFATITVRSGTSETVEGTLTQTYALVVEIAGDTIHEKLYVTTKTGLPRRIESRIGDGRVTVDYFDFNAPIVINDPPC